MCRVLPAAVDHHAADLYEVVVTRKQRAVSAELSSEPQRAGHVAGAADEQLVTPMPPVELGASRSLDKEQATMTQYYVNK